jgi:hypothetical protein
MICERCHQDRAPAAARSVVCRECRDELRADGLRWCSGCHRPRAWRAAGLCAPCKAADQTRRAKAVTR